MTKMTSAQAVFDAIPGLANPEQLKGINAKIQFDLSGEGGGQWVVGVADGQVAVNPGTTESPNVTASMSAADYLAMVNGELKPMTAFMQGKVKIKGDMGLVMKLQSLFGKS